jgi:segregation and condensation protein B
MKEEKVEGTLFESMTQQLQEKQATTQIAAAIESLLFVSGRPLEYAELRKLLDVDDADLTSGLQMLNDQLESQGRGIRLQRLGEQVQLVTAPENARYIAALLDLPMTARLTTAAMETLAVISYRQPITRAQIEAIRGVNSDRAVASLVQHGLVVEIGRAQTIGRPALFATTPEFLQQFGLTSLEQLPGTDGESQSTETGRE